MLIHSLGYAQSRERAQRLIMAGNVYVNHQKADKPGMTAPVDALIEVRGGDLPFVSRGGLKLDKAVRNFGLEFTGRTAMDIGASTGGFTDCMLQNGAAKVFAVDVGYGQLAWSLRTDERVVNLERTNVRYLTPEEIGCRVDFASVDVSFISLRLILPVVKNLVRVDGEAVCLIKPQFEAGKGKVGKKGVVRDPQTHVQVVRDVVQFALDSGFSLLHLDFSPIRGPEGNIEYLMHLRNDGRGENLTADLQSGVEALVHSSHQAFKEVSQQNEDCGSGQSGEVE